MKLLVLVALTAVFTFCSAAETEESFSDLEGSAASKEFTSAERKYFTEALDRFKKYELKKIFKLTSQIRWLDDNHIVFSTKKLPGWVGTSGEPSRIVVMNITDNTFNVSRYRGKLFCLNHLGDLLVRQGGIDELQFDQDIAYEWHTGKWGADLVHIHRPPNSFISNYLCKFSELSYQNHTGFTDEKQTEKYQTIQLLPEHGYLKNTLHEKGKINRSNMYHITLDGIKRFVSDRFQLHTEFYFYPWMDSYFEKSSLNRGPRVFDPSGAFTNVPIPKLLAYWRKASTSIAAGGVLTKAGMLWDVHQDRGDWRKQGIYLESNGVLLRIEEGSGVYSSVSPNGCRVIDSVLRGDPYKPQQQKYIWLVIDICKDKK